MIPSTDCLGIIANYLLFKDAIKILEEFAFHLHMDFLRIDIFPTSKNTFVINELETTSGTAVINNEWILKRLEYGWKRAKNSKHQSFITVQNALAHLSNTENEQCDIKINVNGEIQYSEEEVYL